MHLLSRPCRCDQCSLRLPSVVSAILDSNGHPVARVDSTTRGLEGVAGATGGTVAQPRELDEFEPDNAALDKLTELGIKGQLYEHQAAFTVEEQGAALAGLAGDKTKNLFLRVSQ